MQDIKRILEMISKDSSVMEIGKDGFSLASQLLDIAGADIASYDRRRAIDTFEKICDVNRNVLNFSAMFAEKLTSIGMSAYVSEEYYIAETVFRLLAESDDILAKNNYAYMIRRREIADITDKDHLKALKLLRGGVQKGEAFSTVNMALVFALMIGDDESWHLADDIMKNLSKFGGMQIQYWWESLAKKEDIEGYLVHFFLLRHKQIEQSRLGSIGSIAVQVKMNIEGFPEWLAEGYTDRND